MYFSKTRVELSIVPRPRLCEVHVTSRCSREWRVTVRYSQVGSHPSIAAYVATTMKTEFTATST